MKTQIILVSLVLFAFLVSCTNNQEKKINRKEIIQFIKTNKIAKLKAALQSIENKPAFLNTQDSIGNTWLHYAVGYNNNEVTAIFLVNGADPNIINNEGLTPLDVARKNNYNETLLKIHEFQFQDWKQQEEKFSEEKLEYAVINDNTLILSEFIANNIQIDSMLLSNEFSPLVTALFANSTNAALLLIENGADQNNQFDTRSVLTMAVMFNQPKVVKLLLEKGADVNATDGTLATPIMFAAQEGFLEIVELLLQYNADITKKDKTGETAYDKAIKNNHKALAEKFILAEKK
ncbi:MAG: hypothetical protein CVT95_00390 [Bacteroidetes bacterium HGW-Bacteroidetes-12]|nr:MAG: hypothetical protein CVT95_00390 [Bacteroidetes bacterium HGW-Bacteroidetes-12]